MPFWLANERHDVGWVECKFGGQGDECIAAGIECRLHVSQELFEISDDLHSTA